MSTPILVLLFIVVIGSLIAEVSGNTATVVFSAAWVTISALLLGAALRTGGFL